MYEISLVPDVKGEMIKQQKIRNLVFMICVIVAGSCAAVILILVSIMTGQSIKIASQDTEVSCRSTGLTTDGKTCDSGKFGTGIMKFENVNELLTIQDQMRNINLLNERKMKLSRIFAYLDVLLPMGDDKILIDELNLSLEKNTIYFEGNGYSSNNTHTRSIEAFKKKALASYYDTGTYKRFDSEVGDYVDIPSFCIEEHMENGRIIGVYNRGEPGCEAPMIEPEETEEEAKEEGEGTEGDVNTENKDESNTEDSKKVEKEQIRILRSYKTSEEKEACKAGNNEKGRKTSDCTKDYYFESNCIVYGADGKIDTNATIEACPIIVDDIQVSEPKIGKDGDDNTVAVFEANVPFNVEIFYASNRHMIIVGPSRQNVTDSYIQVRDMFTAKADLEEE